MVKQLKSHQNIIWNNFIRLESTLWVRNNKGQDFFEPICSNLRNITFVLTFNIIIYWYIYRMSNQYKRQIWHIIIDKKYISVWADVTRASFSPSDKFTFFRQKMFYFITIIYIYIYIYLDIYPTYKVLKNITWHKFLHGAILDAVKTSQSNPNTPSNAVTPIKTVKNDLNPTQPNPTPVSLSLFLLSSLQHHRKEKRALSASQQPHSLSLSKIFSL